MATEKQIPTQIASQLPPQFVLWLREFVIATVSDINSVDDTVSGVGTTVNSLGESVDALSTDLADLTDSEVQQLQNIDASTLSILAWLALSKLSFSNDRVSVTNVATARALDRTSGVILATTTVANSDTEDTIYTATIAADALKAGNLIKIHTKGLLSNDTASDDITINVYIGSTLLGTINPAIGNVTDELWDADINLTIRSAGASGSVAWGSHIDIGTDEANAHGIDSIDTTTANDITIKVQWDNAKAANTIAIHQGWMEHKN